MNPSSQVLPQFGAKVGPRAVLAVFLVLLAVAPLVLPDFYVTLLNYIGLSAMVALGLVLLTGVGGLTSFGQAAFVGLGAYTSAWLTTSQELPGWLAMIGSSPWLALLAGLVLTAIVAIVLGSVTLKLSGHFLPLGTMAWGISLYFLFGNMEFLGGHGGLSGIPPISLFGFELLDNRHFYYLVWVFLLLALYTTQNLLDSREGRAIRALKGGMVMAEAMGVDTSRARMVIFVLAALQACAAGWLYAHMQRFVNPTPFGLHIGIEYLFMAVVGGAGQVWADPVVGPALGIHALDEHIAIDALAQPRHPDAAHLLRRERREVDVQQAVRRQPVGQHTAREIGDDAGREDRIAAPALDFLLRCRDGRYPEYRCFHGGCDRPGVGHVLAQVGALVDAGDH